MSDHERRKYVRLHVPLEVRWQSASGGYTARVGDIGVGGCYVDSIAHVLVGEHVSLEVQLPTGGWLALGGEVVNHQPDAGFGVRFTDLTEASQETLARLVDSAGEGRPGS
ncbi:MAG: PilZ domain-containing protein [Pyrinomonadaceae bacterium]|nr:PilZ domain-containing protein [Pyrinomonadaceae bacterium]